MARARRQHRPRGADSGSGAVLSSSSILDADPAERRNLIVEGSIEAEVPLHAHGVSVGPTGRVCGDIFGAIIRVEGEVIGDLFAEAEVRVCASGTVRGTITAPNVIIEDGATIQGQVRVEDDLAAAGVDRAGPATVSA